MDTGFCWPCQDEEFVTTSPKNDCRNISFLASFFFYNIGFSGYVTKFWVDRSFFGGETKPTLLESL